MSKIDHFLQQYGYNEILGNLKKTLNNLDFLNLKEIIDVELEKIDKKKLNFFDYRKLQIEKIVELELHKKTKLNLNFLDENFYSYKLIF